MRGGEESGAGLVVPVSSASAEFAGEEEALALERGKGGLADADGHGLQGLQDGGGLDVAAGRGVLVVAGDRLPDECGDEPLPARVLSLGCARGLWCVPGEEEMKEEGGMRGGEETKAGGLGVTGGSASVELTGGEVACGLQRRG